jgi:hypothetical protein
MEIIIVSVFLALLIVSGAFLLFFVLSNSFNKEIFIFAILFSVSFAIFMPLYLSLKIIENEPIYNIPKTVFLYNFTVNINDTLLYIYWNVYNGVGCCATFGCNYTLFYNTCLYPDFKLFYIYINNIKQSINLSNYNYTCTNSTPWNYIYYNVSMFIKPYSIKIQQTDCNVIVGEQNIIFS